MAHHVVVILPAGFDGVRWPPAVDFAITVWDSHSNLRVQILIRDQPLTFKALREAADAALELDKNDCNSVPQDAKIASS